jgi:hypothetical protein
VAHCKQIAQQENLDGKPMAEGLFADLRTKPNVASSSVTDSKAIDANGRTWLLVSEDSLEGTVEVIPNPPKEDMYPPRLAYLRRF